MCGDVPHPGLEPACPARGHVARVAGADPSSIPASSAGVLPKKFTSVLKLFLMNFYFYLVYLAESSAQTEFLNCG